MLYLLSLGAYRTEQEGAELKNDMDAILQEMKEQIENGLLKIEFWDPTGTQSFQTSDIEVTKENSVSDVCDPGEIISEQGCCKIIACYKF